MQQSVLILPAEAEAVLTNNLPAPLTSLIGREQEVEAVCSLLLRDEVRLLTLAGAGGSGKTRLGLEVVKRLLTEFADGVFFVPLDSISAPGLVMPSIAQALGLHEIAEVGGQPLLKCLQVYLRHQHRLLFLDNFEHVVAAAPLLVELLQACPDLKMLVTSRTVLRIHAEHEFLVRPLALPDLERPPDIEVLSQNAAVALFMQRVQAVRADFAITKANACTIAEVCIQLDGLPLALELAATRMKLLSPQELLVRLKRRLQVLTGGACDLPPRQQTLRNTLAWSYNLLDTQEQQLFRRLSVFAGGCTLQAAKAVCVAIADSLARVFDGITSLLEKNLLQKKESADGDSRLIMLETVREYALECMIAQGEEIEARRAHAEYYLSLAEEAELECRRNKQIPWLRRLRVEQENLRSALNWMMECGDAEAVTRLHKALAYSDQGALAAENTGMVEERVATAERVIQEPVLPLHLPNNALPCHTRLTKREVTILRLVAKGLSSAQIAHQLSIKLLTVNTHERSVYSKLGITSRSAATRYAFEHRLI
ncbi:MAG TPA: LuxR C-terminal-related transcriptional regulator [Ktedonobacteraceae bacterium]|nr:LuxR C-terminal-related transcriptional regulator [Ktedonobacteraceae bacterium]